MIKEIRISMSDILNCPPEETNIMSLLKAKGFPCNESILNPKPKAGLEYFEYHDHKTSEVVVQWREEE